MAIRLAASALAGATELRRDLDAIQMGLGRELTRIRRAAAERLAETTRPLTPLGPGPRSPRDNLPHIRNTIVGRASGVVARHPAGGLLEHGGSIRPRGTVIQFAGRHMAARALSADHQLIEQLLENEIAALIERSL